MEKSVIKDYSWIVRGKQRRKILQTLDRPMTPTQIKEITGIKVTNVSDVVRSMEEINITKCLNPKEKLGRLYELTQKGKKIQKLLV